MLGAILLTGLVAAPAMAYEERDVNGYSLEVGLIMVAVIIPAAALWAGAGDALGRLLSVPWGWSSPRP